MIKIRVSPSVSSFQVDFPATYIVKRKGKKDVKKEVKKRSVRDNGSINFRSGVVKLITNDEWEYLKEKYEGLIGSSLILLGEIKEAPIKTKKEEPNKSATGGEKEKDSKKKNK